MRRSRFRRDNEGNLRLPSEMREVLSQVREQVDPSEEEQAELQSTAQSLKEDVIESASELTMDEALVRVTQTGSTARGTWVSGDRDIDLFMEFDPDRFGEADFGSWALEIAERVLPEGERDYASHPYLVGERNGFDIDLVPCFAVEEASEIQSAVDRTPFHTRYLEPRLDEETASDVRVAKRFLKGIGAYGSDVATQGFSGFLTELLVLEYGSFVEMLEAASEWDTPVRIDPEDHGNPDSFDSALVVIDPTDPDRNVAANLSEEKVSLLQLNAREFLQNPSTSFFFDEDRDSSVEELREGFERRGTHQVAVVFDRPEVVGDTLYPQLQRTFNSLVETLDGLDFQPIRGDFFADDEVVFLFVETAVSEVANVETLQGPPVSIEDSTEDFVETRREESFGPFVDSERVFFEGSREFTTPEGFLRGDTFINQVATGADIRENLLQRSVFTDSDAVERAVEAGFERELDEYLFGTAV